MTEVPEGAITQQQQARLAGLKREDWPTNEVYLERIKELMIRGDYDDDLDPKEPAQPTE